jgi:hypothetical protein
VLVGLAFGESLDDLRRLFEIVVLVTHRATMPNRGPIGNERILQVKWAKQHTRSKIVGHASAIGRYVYHTWQSESLMADDKSKTDGRDRSRVSASEPYEVEYFAEKHGLSAKQARDLIAEIGNDREKLDEAARKISGRRGQA